ncbi:YvrJ family protein [Peribacillus kribbensis]|nr:YvrJ family protein [Peribacillus kribbensis]
MDVLFSFISEVGFPIAVSIYLLYRIESKLDVLIKSIQDLPVLLKPEA